MKKTTRSETLHKIELSGEDIIQLLRDTGYVFGRNPKVVIRVPTGGDYSGEDVAVNDECPVQVYWREMVEE